MLAWDTRTRVACYVLPASSRQPVFPLERGPRIVRLPASVEAFPRRLVLDAGPLIALLHDRDPDHDDAVRGLSMLADRSAQLVTPLPVIFEVYKWLLYEGGYGLAQQGLREMRPALVITYPDAGELDSVISITQAMRRWWGTLEDAVVALTALRLRIPVWTLNYRDLSAFPRLLFWRP